MIDNLKYQYGLSNHDIINHPYDIPMFKNKVFDAIEKTSLERYGTKSVWSKGSSVRDKIEKIWLEKYGATNPWANKEINRKCFESRIANNKKSSYSSKNSQILFWTIYNLLPESFKEHTYFAELNKEFGKRYNDRYMFIDFVISGSINKVIEFYGNYYHMNPVNHDEDSYNKRLQRFAKDVWESDKRREEFIKNKLKMDLLVVWEKDWNDNPDLVLEKCLNFIQH